MRQRSGFEGRALHSDARNSSATADPGRRAQRNRGVAAPARTGFAGTRSARVRHRSGRRWRWRAVREALKAFRHRSHQARYLPQPRRASTTKDASLTGKTTAWPRRRTVSKNRSFGIAKVARSSARSAQFHFKWSDRDLIGDALCVDSDPRQPCRDWSPSWRFPRSRGATATVPERGKRRCCFRP